MKTLTLLLALSLLATSFCQPAFAQGKFTVSLERADGPVVLDTIFAYPPPHAEARFILRLKNDSTQDYTVSNGFRIYSPDGAVWDSTRGDTLGWRPTDPTPGIAILSQGQFDFPYAILYSDADGQGSDTVGFLGVRALTQGLGAGFNDTAWSINVYGVHTASDGKHICLDTAFFEPGGTWVWQGSGGPSNQVFPAWDGLHCFIIKAVGTDVQDRESGLPFDFALGQNYPNPFNPTTTINFDLPTNSRVNLTVYNVLGQRVRTLVDQQMTAGKYQVDWDGTSHSGTKTASGIYFYRLEAGSYIQTKKMVLLK